MVNSSPRDTKGRRLMASILPSEGSLLWSQELSPRAIGGNNYAQSWNQSMWGAGTRRKDWFFYGWWRRWSRGLIVSVGRMGDRLELNKSREELGSWLRPFHVFVYGGAPHFVSWKKEIEPKSTIIEESRIWVKYLEEGQARSPRGSVWSRRTGVSRSKGWCQSKSLRGPQ